MVEIFSAGGSVGEDSFGSGYLIADELVLTAAHVVAGECEVRPVGEGEWAPATKVVWRGAASDAALLRAPGLRAGERVRFGRLATGDRARCRALGFPLAQAYGSKRDTEEIVGQLAPLAGAKRGLLTVHVDGSVPDRDDSGHSPWEGMSGAALFSDRLLVGVVVVAPTHFGTDRLAAEPVTAMVGEDLFRTAVGLEAEGRLDAVEDEAARALLLAPYEPLPANASAEFLRRSPIHLLYPRYGVVPFHGHTTELNNLLLWLDGDGFASALLTGRGGSGKTRLAAELCRRAEEKGWLAGFLEPGGDGDAFMATQASLLLVVDEAHTRLDEVAALIAQFARAGPGVPVRLLLLARDAGEWWQTTLRRRLGGDARAELVLIGAAPREVGSLEQGAGLRREAFRGAAEAFAIKTERSTDHVEEALDDELFDRVLFVHFAALTSLEGGTLANSPTVSDDLLQARIEQEGRYWETSARQSGLKPLSERARRRAVALATLTAASSEGEAAALLAAVPDLTDEPEGERRSIANWLRSLYPGEGFFRSLEPDLLADALLATVLTEVPELADRLLARSDAAQAKRCLSVLTRAARSHDSVASALRAALAIHVSSLWEQAIEVAQETGDPIGSLLANVMEATPQPEIAAQMLPLLPTETVALRELAAVVTRQAYDRLLATQPVGLARDEEAAGLLTDLARRLAALGRREQALAAIEEAVEIRRALAQANREAYLPDLATSLNGLSNRLAELDRREQALAAIEEAVAIRRALAQAKDAHLPDLAASLNNLSPRLAALGRLEQGLATIEEAVDTYRALVRARPDAFLPDLAMSMSTLSNRLAQLGQREEALTAIREAVDRYRTLAQARPDAFLPDLAMALNNLSYRLAALDRPEQALTAIEEAVQIRRSLAQARPDAFLPDLATSLNNLSNALADLGRDEQALAAIEEAVDIYRGLKLAHRDAFLSNLAGSLNNLSIRLAALDRPEQALTAIEEAVDSYRTLAQAHQDAFLPDLAMSLNNLSHRLADLGRREQALAAIDEAVDSYRTLARARPDAFLADLATSLNILSTQLAGLGRREQALAASAEGLAWILSLLERQLHALRDAGRIIVVGYASLCSDLNEDVDQGLVGRMAIVLENTASDRA